MLDRTGGRAALRHCADRSMSSRSTRAAGCQHHDQFGATRERVRLVRVPHPVRACTPKLSGSWGPFALHCVGQEPTQHAPESCAFDARPVLLETRDERRYRIPALGCDWQASLNEILIQGGARVTRALPCRACHLCRIHAASDRRFRRDVYRRASCRPARLRAGLLKSSRNRRRCAAASLQPYNHSSPSATVRISSHSPSEKSRDASRPVCTA
jgi:hypothetical protein